MPHTEKIWTPKKNYMEKKWRTCTERKKKIVARKKGDMRKMFHKIDAPSSLAFSSKLRNK